MQRQYYIYICILLLDCIISRFSNSIIYAYFLRCIRDVIDICGKLFSHVSVFFFYILKLFHFVRFIIIPSQDFQSQANICEDVSKKGIGGARKTILNFPFLMNYHNTSSTLKVLAAGLLLFLYSRFYVVVAGLINYPIQWVKD